MRIVSILVSVCALICWHAVTLPPDGNNVASRPVARGIEQARRGGCLHSEGTAGHCPFLGDFARHGNARHIRPAPAAASAHQTAPPWTNTLPSPTSPRVPNRHSGLGCGQAAPAVRPDLTQ